MESEGVRGAGGEGGRGRSCRWSLAHTIHCLLTGLTPANGITSSHTEEGLAAWLELVAELELLPFSREQLHKLTFRGGGKWSP